VHLIDREVSETIWGVEDGSKWLTSDDARYNYDLQIVDQS
jgi:hypothetical protein